MKYPLLFFFMNNVTRKDFGENELSIDYTRDKNGVAKEFYGLKAHSDPKQYLAFLRLLGFDADFDRKYPRVIVIKPVVKPLPVGEFTCRVKRANACVKALASTNSIDLYLNSLSRNSLATLL